MDAVSTKNAYLSMTGIDQTAVNTENILDLSASVVYKTGNRAESINGAKRFIDDVLIQPTGNTTDTQLKITGNFNALDFKKSLAIFSNTTSGGSNDYGAYVGNDRQNFGNFLIGRYHNNAISGGIFDPAFRIDWTDYTTNAGIIQMLQPVNLTVGGLERISVSSTDTVINNDRVYIKNGGNTRIEVNSNGDTTLNNTANIVLKSNGNTKYYNSPIANYHINDAHYIQNTDATRTYASFDGLNNIITNVDNTLTASATNTLSAINNTITASSGTNTINGSTSITGATTLLGTTTITGNIIANALTITPTELGYLDGATSNLQTQITARVSKTGNVAEDIDGQKTFTSQGYFAYGSGTQHIRLGSIVGKSFMDFRSGGSSAGGGYDVRIQSDGGDASIAGGAYTIEAGTNTLDSKTKNTIKSGGNPKIETTATNTTLTNQNNSLISTTVNFLSSTGTGSQNYFITTGTASNNYMETNGLGCFNHFVANDNGFNLLQTTGTGKNILNSASGSNEIQVGGAPKLTITSSQNTLNNTTRNSIQIGGNEKLACASTNNLLDNTNSNIFRVGGDDKMVLNTTSNTLTNNTNNIITSGTYNWSSNGSAIDINATGAISLKLSNVPKLVFSNTTGTTLYGDSQVAYASSAQNIQLNSVPNTAFIDFNSGGTTNDYDVRIRSDGGTGTVGQGTLSAECYRFLTNRYSVGNISNYKPLMSGCIFASQVNTSLAGGGSVAMSIGGFGRNQFSVQQGILPVNASFVGCVFMSDGNTQTTSRTITLEMTGTDRYTCVCPATSAYQSIVGTSVSGGYPFDLDANNGYYLQIKTSGTSTNAKSWNVILYYQQYA